MVVRLFGFLRRGNSEGITDGWFLSIPESVVSANKVLLIVITIDLTVSGKSTFRPRVVFIILSLGWCVFVSILGVVVPKVEWRRIFRNFIFLLVMEGNWFRRLIQVTLGIADKMTNVESTDRLFRLALLEATNGGWHYMLLTEVMEMVVDRVVVCFTHGVTLEAFGVKISTGDYGATCSIILVSLKRQDPGSSTTTLISHFLSKVMPKAFWSLSYMLLANNKYVKGGNNRLFHLLAGQTSERIAWLLSTLSSKLFQFPIFAYNGCIVLVLYFVNFF